MGDFNYSFAHAYRNYSSGCIDNIIGLEPLICKSRTMFPHKEPSLAAEVEVSEHEVVVSGKYQTTKFTNPHDETEQVKVRFIPAIYDYNQRAEGYLETYQPFDTNKLTPKVKGLIDKADMVAQTTAGSHSIVIHIQAADFTLMGHIAVIFGRKTFVIDQVNTPAQTLTATANNGARQKTVVTSTSPELNTNVTNDALTKRM